MILDRLFRRSPHREAANALYLALVTQARRPGFYLETGVADTPDGRFDMVALHAFLVLWRLKDDRDRTADLAQVIFDVMFADMDRNLREMGVSDIGLGRRVKKLANAFFGRVAAYDAGLAQPVGEGGLLREALLRNLYRKTEPSPEQVARMTDYVRREATALAAVSIETLLEGHVTFGPAPGEETAP